VNEEAGEEKVSEGRESLVDCRKKKRDGREWTR
jgi:hypothetical protein